MERGRGLRSSARQSNKGRRDMAESRGTGGNSGLPSQRLSKLSKTMCFVPDLTAVESVLSFAEKKGMK